MNRLSVWKPGPRQLKLIVLAFGLLSLLAGCVVEPAYAPPPPAYYSGGYYYHPYYYHPYYYHPYYHDHDWR